MEEETPSRWRPPFEQTTPLADPQTPLNEFDPDTPNAFRTPQMSAFAAVGYTPNTPLKMFQQTPPTVQDDAAATPASRGRRQPSYRGSPAAVKLPAIPARAIYSYGTTGTVSLPRMDIGDTAFGGGNSQRDLLKASADVHKRRQRGQEGAPKETPAARSTTTARRKPRYSLKGHDEPASEDDEVLESIPLATGREAPPQAQRQSSRPATRAASQQRAPSVEPIRSRQLPSKEPASRIPSRARSQVPTRSAPLRRPLVEEDMNPISMMMAWDNLRDRARVLGIYMYNLLPLDRDLLITWFVVFGLIGILYWFFRTAAPWIFSLLSGLFTGSGTKIGKSWDKSWSRPVNGGYEAPTGNPADADDVVKRLKRVEYEVERIDREKADLHEIQGSLMKLADEYEKDREANMGRYSELDKLLKRVGQKLNQTDKDIKTLMKYKADTDVAFKRLEKDLPEMMPVRRDSRGRLTIHPEFYAEMQQYFKRVFPERTTGVGGKGGKTETVIVETPARWEDMLYRNKEAIDAYVEGLQKKWWERTKHEETLVTKAEYISLLKKEWAEHLKALQARFAEVKDNLHGQAVSLANLRKMLDSGAYGGSSSGGGKSGPPKSIGESLANGLYSHRISKLADYASHAGGAYVDPERTSATYERHPSNTLLRLFHQIAGMNSKIPKPKVVVSSQPRLPGTCWPFAGKIGTLGLILREPIYVSGMTLEHIEWDNAFIKSATPKTINLWVKVDEVDKYYHELVRAAARALATTTGGVQAPTTMAIFHEYVLVGTFEYQFEPSCSPEQTWTVPVDLRSMNISSERVAVVVSDNYGNSDYTCMYRVRIHGEPVGKEKPKNVVNAAGIPFTKQDEERERQERERNAGGIQWDSEDW